MITITQDKIIEIAVLSEGWFATHQFRNEHHPFLSEREVTDQIIDELEVPTLPRLKLYQALTDLTRDQLCELQAIMWMGRNSVENGDEADLSENFSNLLLEAQKSYTPHDIEYIASKYPLLSKYLKRGMILYRTLEFISF